MSRPKTIVITATVLITIAAASGFAFMAGHRGPGFHRSGMPPFMHQEIGKFILWRMDNAARELELTDDQKTLFNQFKAGLEDFMEKGLQAKLEVHALAHQEFEQKNPDLSKVTGSFQNQMNLLSGMMDKNLTLFNTFYVSLNEDQKTMISEKIKDRIDQQKQYDSCGER